MDRQLCFESERFKQGWVAGFYDAFSDDGCRYDAEVVGPASRHPDFLAGYRLGVAFRRGHVGSVASASNSAAAA